MDDIKDATYLGSSEVKRLKSIALEYYGTEDLTVFNKKSDIYKLENIKTINNNAFHENYPFYNNENNSPEPSEEKLIDYEESNKSGE